METVGSRETLDTLVASGACVLIEIADASEPASLAFSRAVAQTERRVSGLRCARLDLAATPDLAALFGIAAAPAMLLFRAGVGLFNGPAPVDAATLEALVTRALGLDMDRIRRDMDRDRAGLSEAAAFRACPTSRRGDFPAP